MDEAWCVREGWLLKRATVTHRFIRRYVALHSNGQLSYAEAPDNVDLWALRHNKQAKVIDLRQAKVQNEIFFNAGRFTFQLSATDQNNRVSNIEFAHTLGEVVAAWLADIMYLSQRLAGVSPWEPVKYEDFVNGVNSPYASYSVALQKIRGARNAVPSIQRRALIEGIRHYVAVRTSFEASFARYCSEVVLPNEYDRTGECMSQANHPFRLTIHHSIQEHHICKQMAHEHQCSDLLETRLFWNDTRLPEAEENSVCPRALLDIGPIRVGCVALPSTTARYEDENSEMRDTITRRLSIPMWDSEVDAAEPLIIDSTNDTTGCSAIVDCASFLPQVYATSFVRAAGTPDAAEQYTFMCVQILDSDTHIEDSIPIHTHTTQVNADLLGLLAQRLEFDAKDIAYHVLPSQQLQVFNFNGAESNRVYNPLVSMLLGRPSYGSAIITTMICPDNFSHPLRPEFADPDNNRASESQSPRANGGVEASSDWKEWIGVQARKLATDMRYAHGEVDDARAFGAPKVSAERKRVWISNPRQFSSLLHARGVSVRYLPILKGRLQSTNPALHGMICAEIIGRVAKQVLKWRVSNVSQFAPDANTAVHQMLQAALDLLNDIIAADDGVVHSSSAQQSGTRPTRQPSVFWHLESRLCLLLGPYSIFGGFEFTASERRSVRHICASVPIQAILPSVCAHCNINLRPAKIRELLTSGVHSNTQLSLEDIMPHGYQPALNVPLTKMKGRDTFKKKLLSKIQRLVDNNAQNRRVSLPAGSLKDRRQMLERENVTDAVEEVLRLMMEPRHTSPVLLYVSIFESVLAKQAATLGDSGHWTVHEFERVIRMLCETNEHGTAPPLFPAGLAAVAAVARVCNLLTLPESRSDAQLRDQIIRRFITIWQFMYVNWPLSFDGVRSYLWTASPMIPLLFMHMRNCLAPEIAQRIIRSTTLPFSSLQTSGIILADLLEAMQHTLSNEPGMNVSYEVMMHLLEPGDTASEAAHTEIAPDSGRVLLQGSLTGLSLEAQAKRRASIRTMDQKSSQRTPFLPLPLPDHMAVWKVSCGQRHTALLTTQGLLYTFGHGEGGRLGHGNQNTMTVPCVVQYFLDRSLPITDIACGKLHTLAVTASGEAFSWGWGEAGRLGIGATIQELAPKSVHRLRSNGVKVVSVGCGGEHSLFVSSDGHLYSCGNGAQGQLGHGAPRDYNQPKRVGGALANIKVASAAGGGVHTVICTTEGDVYSWGFGQSGALGHGDFESSLTPRRLQSFANFNVDGERIKIVQVACGEYFTLARDAWGGVWSWGDGALGQLGTLDMDRIDAEDDRLHTPHKVLLPFLGEDSPNGQQMNGGSAAGGTRVVRMQSVGIRQLQSIESMATDIALAKEEATAEAIKSECLSRPKACYIGAGDTAGICLTTSGTLLLWGSITGRKPEEHELKPHPVPVVSFAVDTVGTTDTGAAKPVHTVLVRAADVGGYQLVAATPVMGDGTKAFDSEEIRKLLERRLLGDINDNMWQAMIQQEVEQQQRSRGAVGAGGTTRGRRAASPTQSSFTSAVRSFFLGGNETQPQEPPRVGQVHRSRSVVEMSPNMSTVAAAAPTPAPAPAPVAVAAPAPAAGRNRAPPQRRRSLPGQITRPPTVPAADSFWSPAIRSREFRKIPAQQRAPAGQNAEVPGPNPQAQQRQRRDLSPPPRRESTWRRNSITPGGSREGSFSDERAVNELSKVPSSQSVQSMASTSSVSSVSGLSTHSDPQRITNMRSTTRRTVSRGSPRAHHDRSSSHEQSDNVPEILLEAARKPPSGNQDDNEHDEKRL